MRSIINLYFNDHDKPLMGQFVALTAREKRTILRRIQRTLDAIGATKDYIVEAGLEDDLEEVLENIENLHKED